jgi:hypothetical protein
LKRLGLCLLALTQTKKLYLERNIGCVLKDIDNPDMQKVENLPPADFQVKISAKGQNQTLLLGFMNFSLWGKIAIIFL